MTSKPESELERRLRRLHRGLDTSASFAPALKARIESLRGGGDERARLERLVSANRARLETEARLRRRFWLTVLGTLGAGIGAAFGAWLAGPSLGRALLALTTGGARGFTPLAVASLALLAVWLWLAARGATRGGLPRLALG